MTIASHTSEIIVDDRLYAAWSYVALDTPVTDTSFGVKDVIDVAGMPTSCAFAPFRDRIAEKDSAVVAMLRQAGWTPVGKTETTQFAYSDPAPTVNPLDPSRTPGGSSTGSAVAVARGHVRMTLGTQTGGSTIRPAAYNGIVGVKPTFGLIPTDGVFPVAQSLDTVGILTDTVSHAAAVLDALGIPVPAAGDADAGGLSVAAVTPPFDDAETENAWATVLQTLEGALAVTPRPFPDIDIPTLVDVHRGVMGAEAWKTHQDIFNSPNAAYYGAKFRALLELGRSIVGTPEEGTIRSRATDMAQPLGDCVPTDGVLLMPAIPGQPPTRENTGSSRYAMPWTVLGRPVVVVPWRLKAGDGQFVVGGVQVIAQREREADALRVAGAVEKALVSKGLHPSSSS